MSLREKVQADIEMSLREKNTLRCSVLRMLKAVVLNREIEKKSKLCKDANPPVGEELEKLSKLTDEEMMEAILSETKKRKDSIEQYQKGNRPDLVEQEEKELEILKEYLPEQMGEEEIRKLVKEVIRQLAGKTGVSNPREMGKVMGVLMPQLKGMADGGLISKIVQEELKNK